MTLHLFSNNHNDGKVMFDFGMVHFSLLNELTQNFFFFDRSQLTGAENDRKIVDTCWHVFPSDVKIFENLQNLASKSNFTVHEVFGHVDADKARVTSDSNDWEFITTVFQNDTSSWMIRIVGILDDKRDFSAVGREQSFIVKD